MNFEMVEHCLLKIAQQSAVPPVPKPSTPQPERPPQDPAKFKAPAGLPAPPAQAPGSPTMSGVQTPVLTDPTKTKTIKTPSSTSVQSSVSKATTKMGRIPWSLLKRWGLPIVGGTAGVVAGKKMMDAEKRLAAQEAQRRALEAEMVRLYGPPSKED